MMQKISNMNRLEMTFPAIPENERTGRTLAAVFSAVLDPTMEELCDFKTAVSEAVTNAIIHAYPGTPGQIELILERTGNRIRVEVKDQGIGIRDVERSMEPLYTTVTSGERSGMGFTFMEAFTDDLQVISAPGQGTRVILSKTMGDYEAEKLPAEGGEQLQGNCLYQSRQQEAISREPKEQNEPGTPNGHPPVREGEEQWKIPVN